MGISVSNPSSLIICKYLCMKATEYSTLSFANDSILTGYFGEAVSESDLLRRP